MLIWNLYFLIKLGLHATGVLGLDLFWNFWLFAMLLLSNIIAKPNRVLLRTLRHLVFAVPAVALLLHELGLVVSWALLDQIKALFGFSPGYLWELAKRTLNPVVVWLLLLAYLLVRVADRYLRTSAWVGVLLLGVGASQAGQAIWQSRQSTEPLVATNPLQGRENPSPAELLALGQIDFQRLQVARDQQSVTPLRDMQANTSDPELVLRGFFERQRAVALQAFERSRSAPDFDLIFLQLCSLSWADLRVAKQTQHPLIRQADFIFENFNSATSYSGPAAIRLLRGKCGQQAHNALYQPTEDSCLLFEQLRQAGFSLDMGMNHDGRFQNFANDVRKNMGAEVSQPVGHSEVPVGVLGFDGSTVGRDGDYLRAWWAQRLNRANPATALYYNSITLHDGNRLPNNRLNSIDSYPIRLERLFNDVQSLLGEIRRSGRKAMVVIVPEHGAGLSGEYGQLVGLRELPTPALTRVPVFGYWISPDYTPTPNKQPVSIKQNLSYTALSELVVRWMNALPEEQAAPQWPLLLADLPATRLVSQQGNITVMESQGNYWLKAPGTGWRVLGPSTVANTVSPSATTGPAPSTPTPAVE